MNRQNNLVWNVQKPINWSFPTSQNNTNRNFNSYFSSNPIKYNTNSPNNVSALKPFTNPQYCNTTSKTNLDPVEDMDWSYYDPSWYANNYSPSMQFNKTNILNKFL